jgi:hypothetical protein
VAVTLSAPTNQNIDTGLPSTTTFSHVSDGSPLYVTVAWWRGTTPRDVTGITYNGVAMTERVLSAASGLDDRTCIYELLTPDSGTHDVVVTMSGGTPGAGRISAYNTTGADADAQAGADTSGTATASPLSVAISGEAGDLILWVVANSDGVNNVGTMSPTDVGGSGSPTEIYDADISGEGVAAAKIDADGVTDVGYTWTGNSAADGAIAAIVIQQTAFVGPAGDLLLENGTDRYLLEDGSGVILLEGDEAGGGVSVTPGTASLTLTAFAPTVTRTQNVTVTPGAASLVTARLTPTVTVSDHKRVTPGTASLVTETFAPTVVLGQRVTPGTASLVLAAQTPTVTATANLRVTPGAAALTVTLFAPTVSVSDHKRVVPGTGTIVMAGFAPTVTASDHKVVTPGTASLTITTFAPTVTVGAGGGPTPVPMRTIVHVGE